MPAFHELLYQTHVFYKDDDIATVQADAFPVLNALRELHFVLTEGMHNQFGDLPSQARVEMLIQQWLLARPEMREFLRGRVMVPYPERWMDSVDTMKTLQGWTDVPRALLQRARRDRRAAAAVGALRRLVARRRRHHRQGRRVGRAVHRSVVQRYLYAYRMVTGVDLTVDRVEVQPRAGAIRTAADPHACLDRAAADAGAAGPARRRRAARPAAGDPRPAAGAHHRRGTSDDSRHPRRGAGRPRVRFRYAFTPADVVWLGRLLAVASSGPYRGRVRAILWRALARFASSQRPGLSLAAFIQHLEPSLPRVPWGQLPPDCAATRAGRRARAAAPPPPQRARYR